MYCFERLRVCTFLECVYRKTHCSVLILHLTGEIIFPFVRKESRWCRDYSNVVFPPLQMPVKSFDLSSQPVTSEIITHLFVYLSIHWFVHLRLYVLCEAVRHATLWFNSGVWKPVWPGHWRITKHFNHFISTLNFNKCATYINDVSLLNAIVTWDRLLPKACIQCIYTKSETQVLQPLVYYFPCCHYKLMSLKGQKKHSCNCVLLIKNLLLQAVKCLWKWT